MIFPHAMQWAFSIFEDGVNDVGWWHFIQSSWYGGK